MEHYPFVALTLASHISPSSYQFSGRLQPLLNIMNLWEVTIMFYGLNSKEKREDIREMHPPSPNLLIHCSSEYAQLIVCQKYLFLI